jgi:hypothetical protein
MMLLAGLLPFALAQAADVTSAMLEEADKDTKNVLSFGMGSQGPLASEGTKDALARTPVCLL